MPCFTEDQKYQMAAKRQAIKSARKAMFKAPAGSVLHIIKEIHLNTLRFQLKSMEEWGQFQAQKSNNSA